MKRRTVIQSLGTLSAASLAAAPSGWSNAFAEQLRRDLLGHWRSTREYSLDVLEAMPAEHFGFKPVDEVFTFGEQLEHFGGANMAYFSRFDNGGTRPTPGLPKSRSKDALRGFLAASFDYVESVLSGLTEEQFLRRDVKMGFPAKPHTAQDVFLRAYMHTAHHRGQIVTYLRLKGIEPPPWRFPPNGDA